LAMSNSHRLFFAQLCLIALLLWGQVAVAQHETDHSWHDATELCQVFSSADHAKAALVAPQISIAHSGVGKDTSEIVASLAESRVARQSARGPPQTTI
ncbi:MAG: DUF2607 family protein, partial [Arenicella sp.]|nr:DUF2607 family protein [Arenicella sp.]